MATNNGGVGGGVDIDGIITPYSENTTSPQQKATLSAKIDPTEHPSGHINTTSKNVSGKVNKSMKTKKQNVIVNYLNVRPVQPSPARSIIGKNSGKNKAQLSNSTQTKSELSYVSPTGLENKSVQPKQPSIIRSIIRKNLAQPSSDHTQSGLNYVTQNGLKSMKNVTKGDKQTNQPATPPTTPTNMSSNPVIKKKLGVRERIASLNQQSEVSTELANQPPTKAEPRQSKFVLDGGRWIASQTKANSVGLRSQLSKSIKVKTVIPDRELDNPTATNPPTTLTPEVNLSSSSETKLTKLNPTTTCGQPTTHPPTNKQNFPQLEQDNPNIPTETNPPTNPISQVKESSIGEPKLTKIHQTTIGQPTIHPPTNQQTIPNPTHKPTTPQLHPKIVTPKMKAVKLTSRIKNMTMKKWLEGSRNVMKKISNLEGKAVEEDNDGAGRHGVLREGRSLVDYLEGRSEYRNSDVAGTPGVLRDVAGRPGVLREEDAGGSGAGFSNFEQYSERAVLPDLYYFGKLIPKL